MLRRNTMYTPRRGAWVCARIASGEPIGVTKRTRATYETLQQWLEEHEDFRAKYAAACEQLADRLAAEMVAIADDASRDFKAGGKDGQDRALDREALARAKLRIEIRRWRAMKLAPQKYGDKAQPVTRGLAPLSHEDALAQLD
jgi:hypothetical protein